MLFALGFIFMFTIGGLIIHLVFPLKVIKCWEILTIILLCKYFIYLVKMYNFEQPAGNQQISYDIPVRSPETIHYPYNLLWEVVVQEIKNLLLNLNIYFSSYINIKFYSTSPSWPPATDRIYSIENNPKNLKPVKVYDSLKDDRIQILKDQKDKSGVYFLINNINGHTYVGSSINIAARMRNYLNNAFLKSKQNNNMPIVKALLKYGQSNFSLWILEYVDHSTLTLRETFYIILLMPYYNVLKQGYSSLGYKHTEETKNLLSELAKNRTHSDKTKTLIAKALVGENNPFYNKNHSMETKIRLIEANSAYPIYIYNSFKELLVIFPSVKTLAKLIKSNHSTLVNVVKNNTLFRGEWYLLNIPYKISDTPFISDWRSQKCEQLVEEINKCSYIKKAVFVYDTSKNLIGKYDGVTSAQRALNINHSIIKKYAKIDGTYKGYIFSYERLNS